MILSLILRQNHKILKWRGTCIKFLLRMKSPIKTRNLLTLAEFIFCLNLREASFILDKFAPKKTHGLEFGLSRADPTLTQPNKSIKTQESNPDPKSWVFLQISDRAQTLYSRLSILQNAFCNHAVVSIRKILLNIKIFLNFYLNNFW